jgi:FAD/FMN-containing dehydrogenase
MTNPAIREKTELLSAIRTIVGDRGLLIGEDAGARSCDPFRDVPPQGGAIVRPVDTQQLSDVLALCNSRLQKVVPQGGRTGLVGGAYVNTDEIAISLERMTRIEEIDPIGSVGVVQAGVTLEGFQNAVAEQGLFYPVDLGAKGSATIGGTIATNAGGNRVIRWGMTRQNVLGLEAVLADGTIVSSMNRMLKNNTGYDVKQVFIGSEGTCGIVTRAVLRLVKAPRSQFVAFASVPGYDALLALLGSARELAQLSAFEVMWQDFYGMAAETGPEFRPVEPDQPYYVLIEMMGYDENLDTEQFSAFLERAYRDGLVADAVTASSTKQINDLWRIREGAETLKRAMSPFVGFDVSLDIRRIEDFVERVRQALLDHYGFVKQATLGHLGDSNIHIAVHVGSETIAQEYAIERIVYGILKEYDGALTAEHGIGRMKKEFLPEHKTPGEMAVMKMVRRGLDPDGVLNQDLLF